MSVCIKTEWLFATTDTSAEPLYNGAEVDLELSKVTVMVALPAVSVAGTFKVAENTSPETNYQPFICSICNLKIFSQTSLFISVFVCLKFLKIRSC